MKANSMREGNMMKDQEILNAVKEMRISWKENDDKRDSGLPHDIPEVTRIDDLQYGKDPKWNLLDLYLPKNVKGKIPVIINIHYSRWRLGLWNKRNLSILWLRDGKERICIC